VGAPGNSDRPRSATIPNSVEHCFSERGATSWIETVGRDSLDFAADSGGAGIVSSSLSIHCEAILRIPLDGCGRHVTDIEPQRRGVRETGDMAVSLVRKAVFKDLKIRRTQSGHTS
jgi:hypothetical protein